MSVVQRRTPVELENGDLTRIMAKLAASRQDLKRFKSDTEVEGWTSSFVAENIEVQTLQPSESNASVLGFHATRLVDEDPKQLLECVRDAECHVEWDRHLKRVEEFYRCDEFCISRYFCVAVDADGKPLKVAFTAIVSQDVREHDGSFMMCMIPFEAAELPAVPERYAELNFKAAVYASPSVAGSRFSVLVEIDFARSNIDPSRLTAGSLWMKFPVWSSQLLAYIKQKKLKVAQEDSQSRSNAAPDQFADDFPPLSFSALAAAAASQPPMLDGGALDLSSPEMWPKAFQHDEAPVAVLAADGNEVLYCNPAFSSVFGTQRTAVSALPQGLATFSASKPPWDDLVWKRLCSQVLRGSYKYFRMVRQYRSFDRSQNFVCDSYVAALNDKYFVLELYLRMAKLPGKSLRTFVEPSECTWFRSLYDLSPVDTVLLSLDGTICYANPSVCRAIGCTQRELLAENFASFVAPQQRTELFTALHTLQEGLCLADGQTLQVMTLNIGKNKALFPKAEAAEEEKGSLKVEGSVKAEGDSQQEEQEEAQKRSKRAADSATSATRSRAKKERGAAAANAAANAAATTTRLYTALITTVTLKHDANCSVYYFLTQLIGELPLTKDTKRRKVE